MSEDLDFDVKNITAPMISAHQETMPTVTIFGAGIAGLTAAHELIERGFAVQVVEPVLDPDEEHACLVGGLAANQHAHIPAPVTRAHPYLFNEEEDAEDQADPPTDPLLSHDRKVLVWIDGDKDDTDQDEFLLMIDSYTSAPIPTVGLTSSEVAQKIKDVAANWGFVTKQIGAFATKLSIAYPDPLSHRIPSVAIINQDESGLSRVAYESPLRLELMRTLELHDAPARIPTPERIQMGPGLTDSTWAQVADDHGAKNHDKITVVLHRLRKAFLVFEADRMTRQAAAEKVVDASRDDYERRMGNSDDFPEPQPLSERNDLREGLVVELRGHCHVLAMSDEERLETSVEWAGWVRDALVLRNGGLPTDERIPDLEERLVIVPVRDLEPIASSRRATGRRANDRVEFRIVEALVPGEHGYRFFPRFYRHLFDTMKRTPILDENGQANGDTAFDRLVPTKVIDVALEGGGPVHEVPVDRPNSLEELRKLLEINLKQRKAELDRSYEQANNGDRRVEKDGGLGLTPTDLLRFQLAIVKFLTSSRARREAEFEDISWFDFLLGKSGADGGDAPYSKAMLEMILETPQALVAMSARESDARSQGVIYCQLLLDSLTSGDESNMTLNGPTSAVWLCDWKRYLERQGVRFFSGKLVKLIWALKSGSAAMGGQPLEPDEEAEVTEVGAEAADAATLATAMATEVGVPDAIAELDPIVVTRSQYELVPVVGTVSQTRTNVSLGVLFADGEAYAVAIDGHVIEVEAQENLTDATNAVETAIRDYLEANAGGYDVQKQTIRRPGIEDGDDVEILSLGVLRILQRGSLLSFGAEDPSLIETLALEVNGRTFSAGRPPSSGILDALIHEITRTGVIMIRPFHRGRNLFTVDCAPGCELLYVPAASDIGYDVWVRDVAPDSAQPDLHVHVDDDGDRGPEVRESHAKLLQQALQSAVAARNLGYEVHLFEPDGVLIDFKGPRKRVEATGVQVGVQISVPEDSEPYLNVLTMPPMTIEARSSNLSVLAPEPEVAGDRFLEREVLPTGVIDPLGPNGPDFYLMATPFEEASRLVWQAYEDQPFIDIANQLDGCMGEFQQFERMTDRREVDGTPLPLKRDATGRPPQNYPLRDLSGIQYYFKNEVRIGHGHTYYPDAPWGLSSISQLAHWQERVSRRDGFLGQLSVDIGDFYQAYPTRDYGRVPAAWRSTRQEIAERTWEQIKSGVEDIRGSKIVPPTYFHLDEGIEFETDGVFHSGSGLVFAVIDDAAALTGATLNDRAISTTDTGSAADIVDDLVATVTGDAANHNFLAKKVEGDRLYVAPVAGFVERVDAEISDRVRVRVKVEGAPTRANRTRKYTLRINGKDVFYEYDSGTTPKTNAQARREIRDALVAEINTKIPGVTADPKGRFAIRLRAYEALVVCAIDDGKRGRSQISLASPRLLDADELENLVVVDGQTPTRNRTPFLINNPRAWVHRPGVTTFEEMDAMMPPNAGHHGETLPKEGERRGIMYFPTQMRWLMIGNQMATYTRMSTMESANESARHAVTAILHGILNPAEQGQRRLDFNGQGLLLGDMPRIWDPEDHELDDTAPLRRLDEKLMEDHEEGQPCPPHFFDILRLEEMIDQIPDLEAKPADAAALQRLFTETGGQLVRDWSFTEVDDIQRGLQAVIASLFGITAQPKPPETP